MSVTILLATSRRLLAEGIRLAVADADDMEILRLVTTAPEAVTAAQALQPRVTLISDGIRGMPLVTCVRRIRGVSSSRIGVLSDHASAGLIQTSFAAGANGLLLTSIDPRDLPSAIRQLVETTAFTSARVGVVDAAGSLGLTEREHSILQLLAEGLANQAIARRLGIGDQAVKFHLYNMYRKLNV